MHKNTFVVIKRGATSDVDLSYKTCIQALSLMYIPVMNIILLRLKKSICIFYSEVETKRPKINIIFINKRIFFILVHAPGALQYKLDYFFILLQRQAFRGFLHPTLMV